jgi:hypothetical protein
MSRYTIPVDYGGDQDDRQTDDGLLYVDLRLAKPREDNLATRLIASTTARLSRSLNTPRR